MKYLILLEPTPTGFSSYSPDLPGCIATGESQAECETNIREAIEFHLDGMREGNEPIPAPGTTAMSVEACRVGFIPPLRQQTFVVE